jgi:hypothetical protein
MHVSLTTYEMQLVTDPKVLLTKNRIIKMVYELFGELVNAYKKELDNYGFKNEDFNNAKISRGENYKGLAYVIMDYPRHFGKTDVFAIRSFFWWGNFFSITIHLSGQYQKKYAPSIETAIRNGLFEGWFIGTSQNQWEHHFGVDNYELLEKEKPYNLSQLPFLKLAKKIPLSEWDQMISCFSANFQLIVKAIVNYAPIR